MSVALFGLSYSYVLTELTSVVDACVLVIAERYQSRLPLSKVDCRLIDTSMLVGS